MKIVSTLFLVLLLTVAVFGTLKTKSMYGEYKLLQSTVFDLEDKMALVQQQSNRLKIENSTLSKKLRTLEAQNKKLIKNSKTYAKGIKSLYD